jgi:hypothetical protein
MLARRQPLSIGAAFSITCWKSPENIPEVAPRREALAGVLGFALTGQQISRYVLEVVGAISPSTQRWIRRKALGLPRTA